MIRAELSIDIPPESPLASPKKSKKRKAKDSAGGGKDKKPKRSKSKSVAKADKVAEISYDDASDGDDEPADVCCLHFTVNKSMVCSRSLLADVCVI